MLITIFVLATLTMNSGSSFSQEITDTTPCTGFNQITVTGSANLCNATNVTLTSVGPAPVASANSGTLPTTGTSLAIAIIGLGLILSGIVIARRCKNNLFI